MDFLIKAEDIKILTDKQGACIVSNQILVDGKKVGYMYRETPSKNYNDSGWRIFSGDESEEYCENSENFNIVELNTLCNYDNSVLDYLDSEINVAYIKTDGEFIKEDIDSE